PTQVTRGPSLPRSWSVWHSCTEENSRTAEAPLRDGAAELSVREWPRPAAAHLACDLRWVKRTSQSTTRRARLPVGNDVRNLCNAGIAVCPSLAVGAQQRRNIG